MKTELLAPAGSFESLRAAIQSGADAVYFGTKQFNMRAAAKNFEINQLPRMVDICKTAGVKTNLTLNVQIYNNETDKARRLLEYAKKTGIDAVIAWDPAVLQFASEVEMPVHISTQASVANYASALFYEKLGAKVIVLARELSLEQITDMKKRLIKAGSKLKLEGFAHGAMCVAVSGRCFLSHHAYGKSANRGECLQPCRRSYRIIDDTGKLEYRVENHTLLSPKDLCTIPVLPAMIKAGIEVFKIEGRNRSPEYVREVVDIYKTALIAVENGNFSEALVRESENRLKLIYNKGFHTGFYMGTPSGEDFSAAENSASPRRKAYIGRVKKSYKKIKVFDLLVHTGKIFVGQKIMITGKSTGVVYDEVLSIHDINGNSVYSALKGELAGIMTREGVIPRPNDKVFTFEKR